MKETSERYGKYIVGYLCPCGWSAGPYECYVMYNLPGPTFTFHDCCPECGRRTNEIERVSGRYLFRKTRGWLGWSKEEKVKFVPKGQEGSVT